MAECKHAAMAERPQPGLQSIVQMLIRSIDPKRLNRSRWRVFDELSPADIDHLTNVLLTRRILKRSYGLTCWLWPNGRPETYASVKHVDRYYQLHRLSHHIFKGPWLEGQIIRHGCPYKGCFNPDHLRVGTYIDNAHDKKVADLAPRILDMSLNGLVSTEIAPIVGLPVAAVYDVVVGRPWFWRERRERGPHLHRFSPRECSGL